MGTTWGPWDAERRPSVGLRCSGCDAEVSLLSPLPFACPNAGRDDDTDHVLVRRLDHGRVEFPEAATGNPFIDYASLMSLRYRATEAGLSGPKLERLIATVDEQVAQVDGTGFVATPWLEQPRLAASLGLSADNRLWTKDETANVSGSHKARHLMGVMLHLRLAERLGMLDQNRRRPLAIASCGNAALAAAVVAKAAAWPLRVFVPPDADRSVLRRLRQLDAEVTTCERDDKPGDPCVRALRAALDDGALPFTVQGNENGLAVEGGLTLGYELAQQVHESVGRLDVLVIQVGGGALASACVAALRDAVRLGLVPKMPRICTVQTKSAAPLARAYARVVTGVAQRVPLAGPPPDDPRARADWLRDRRPDVIEAQLRHAATHRSQYMWPWESVPKSVAHGILDDETYDWWAVVDGMVRTGGVPLVVDESTLRTAHRSVIWTTGVQASATGTAGVAGVSAMARDGLLRPGEIVGVLLTGRQRSAKSSIEITAVD